MVVRDDIRKPHNHFLDFKGVGVMQQGGGITRHEGVKFYIDLIVGDLTSIKDNYPQTAQLFATFAKHRQGPSNFGFAEIDKDDRLHSALSKTQSGSALYQRLLLNMPIVTVSNDILGNAENTDQVNMFKLEELESDPLGILANIQEAAHIETESDKNAFLDGIERLNKILSIKPGFFGISINVNQIIDDWIQHKRSAMLPRFHGKII